MAHEPRDERGRQLQTFLRTIADGIDWLRTIPTGWQYGSIERLTLEQGRWFAPRAMPDAALMGQPKGCFRNAALLAATMPGLSYVEGYGLTGAGFPIMHAWCVQRETGLVFDPTWPWGRSRDLLIEDGALCGIAFPIEAVLARHRTGDGEVPMLDCWLIGYPALTLPPDLWGDEREIVRAYRRAREAYRVKHTRDDEGRAVRR